MSELWAWEKSIIGVQLSEFELSDRIKLLSQMICAMELEEKEANRKHKECGVCGVSLVGHQINARTCRDRLCCRQYILQSARESNRRLQSRRRAALDE